MIENSFCLPTLRHPSEFRETFRQAKEFKINKLAAARVRARYLFEWIEMFLESETELGNELTKQALEEIEYLYRNAYHEHKPTKDTITEYEIQKAKQYPINQLIEFDRQGKAIAWCHNDKRPSLMWNKKNNTAKCYPCGKTFDAIEVLRERDGIKFLDAVRRLQ